MVLMLSHFVGKVGFEPTFSTSRYVYSVYKTPTVPAEVYKIKKPSPFETGFEIYVKSKFYITQLSLSMKRPAPIAIIPDPMLVKFFMFLFYVIIY
jgi:hypothetical protein